MKNSVKLILFGLTLTAATVSAANPPPKPTPDPKAPHFVFKPTPAPTPTPIPVPVPTGPTLPSNFGIFEVVDKPSPSSIQVQTPDKKETLNVEPMPIMPLTSYESASIVNGGVSIEFAKNAAAIFHNYTFSHVGKRIALGVSGHIVSTMVIKEPIDNRLVTLGVVGKDANDIVTSIKLKPKPPEPTPLPRPTPTPTPSPTPAPKAAKAKKK